MYHLGAALQEIADTHAEVLTPRQRKALYMASKRLWDDQEAPSPAETALLLLRMAKFRLEPRLDDMEPERGCVLGPGLALSISEAINHGIGALAASDWRTIDAAPKDRLIEVFAPGEPYDLPDLVCLCQWHEDAGFCVCELREPTHWRPHEPPVADGPQGQGKPVDAVPRSGGTPPPSPSQPQSQEMM